MVKKIIAVDIDDVLASSAAGFVAYSNERWGTNLAPDDYDEHWGKMWNVDHAEVVRRSKDVYLASVHGQFKSREDALPVLRKLTEKYELVIATSRHRLLEPTTLEWLDLHYSGIFSNVHFAGIWDKGLHLDKSIHMTKGELLSTIKADYMIDDQPKHCIAAAQAGINAVLFGEYPWSTSLELPDGVTRAKDWQAVESISMKPDKGFRDRVYVIVAQIPAGRVMTYGQIAALCGSPRSARIVGGVAHWGDPSLPWQRVVKKDGSLAEGFPGGIPGHAAALEAEGIRVGENGKINIQELLWQPNL